MQMTRRRRVDFGRVAALEQEVEDLREEVSEIRRAISGAGVVLLSASLVVNDPDEAARGQ